MKTEYIRIREDNFTKISNIQTILGVVLCDIIKSKLINLLWEISLAKHLSTVMLVFWCIDKLLRYLAKIHLLHKSEL